MTLTCRILLSVLPISMTAAAMAAPAIYEMDPSHTYPSFEADHLGISLWRGKFNRTTGTMILDKAAGTGSVDVTVDLSSVDFGHDEMNTHATGPDFFDISKHPVASYTGKLVDFKKGAPTRVVGELTLHGVTKPVTLKINHFKCIPHPLHKRDLCGADAIGTFNRDEFGLDVGKDWNFRMDVTLRIQMEAVLKEDKQ